MASITLGWDLAGWVAILAGLTLLLGSFTWATCRFVAAATVRCRWTRRDNRELEVLLANALDLDTDPSWDDD